MDDVAERFGRPRAHSLSRRDMSLPAWEEEDAEGGGALTSSEPSRLEERRRTVSMSFAEEYRRGRPSRQVTCNCYGSGGGGGRDIWWGRCWWRAGGA